MLNQVSPNRSDTAGFTLVEALAALTVMTISMAAIGALASSNMRLNLAVERHLADVETARKVVAGMPPRKDLSDRSLTGVLDNHEWRLESASYPNALGRPNIRSAWEPRRLALHVVSSTGTAVEIDMIRLRRVQ